MGGGRIIPVLVLDTRERPNIQELVRVHEPIAPGDVTFYWGQMDSKNDSFDLFLQFKRPIDLLAIFTFDIDQQGGLVDQILASNAMYIQPGQPGDRVSSGFENPKILVEIPDTGVQKIGDRLYQKYTTRRFREKGLSRQQAKAAAQDFIEEWRKFGRQRALKSPSSLTTIMNLTSPKSGKFQGRPSSLTVRSAPGIKSCYTRIPPSALCPRSYESSKNLSTYALYYWRRDQVVQ